MIVGAVMACYNKHIYEMRIGKGGVILGFLGVSWVSRGTLVVVYRMHMACFLQQSDFKMFTILQTRNGAEAHNEVE